MSEIKVNKLTPKTNCGTVTLGDSGDTFTIPAGVTISNSGTASGFGSTGEISWDTTPKTGDFTGVSGVGYFINTAGGAVTVTLPGSPSAGNVIGVSDYNSTAATNAITINRNSNKINGATNNLIITKANSAIQLVYIDATTGWQSVFTGNTTDVVNTALVATGGTETTCGDFKIHTFTGPGTFTVTNAASGACEPNNVVSYLVIAGGGSGAVGDRSGGGGAGGFREVKNTDIDSYTASPLNGYSTPGNRITVTAQAYPITVGAGGATIPSGPGSPGFIAGNDGSVSTFSTISSAGGGGGGGPSPSAGRSGGSGGGGSHNNGAGGSGNTPPTTPSQGNNGGAGNFNVNAGSGGGGGAGAVGQTAAGQPTPGRGGDGGAGVATSITGSPVTRAGGGGGSGDQGPRSGGSGGGGNAGHPGPGGGGQGFAGTVNTGGGGGDSGLSSTGAGFTGGAGGSGIVVIRYKFQ